MRVFCLWLLLAAACWAQPSRYVLGNGVIHTAQEEPFLGYVVVNGERIERVGKGEPPAGDIVDLNGGHLYPALIDADSTIGLVEIESLRATRDHREVGDLNPNLVARNAFRAESDAVGVTRSQGVLFSGVNPRGGFVCGQGSVMRLWGWTWEDMTVVPSWTLAIDWPDVSVAWDLEKKKKKERVQEIGRQLYVLSDAFEEAVTYSDESGLVDVKWGALKPFAEGLMPLLIRTDDRDEIRSVLDWTQTRQVKPVLISGRNVHHFADELARRDIPVIYGSLFNENPSASQDYDLHYRTPKLLRDRGVKVALSASGLAFDSREIRDLAGRARAFGLSDLEALRTVTLYPAQILGVDHRLGSIEAHKEASLVVCEGDILEVGPRVTKAWGAGRQLDLSDHQKRLYEKYRQHNLSDRGR
jgi:hypothetical protein